MDTFKFETELELEINEELFAAFIEKMHKGNKKLFHETFFNHYLGDSIWTAEDYECFDFLFCDSLWERGLYKKIAKELQASSLLLMALTFLGMANEELKNPVLERVKKDINEVYEDECC